MSQARFDGGQQYVWETRGVFTGGVSASDPPQALVTMDPVADGGLFRVDYASVVLRYLGALDGGVTAELSLSSIPGDYPAFLVASRGSAEDAGFLGVGAGSQLSLPIYVTAITTVFLRVLAHGSTHSSNASGTVGISIARGF